MMNLSFARVSKYVLGVTIAGFMAACGGPSAESKLDTPTKGTIKISVDETYQPLIEAELKVFHSQYPNTNIIAEYKPEADCFKDMFADSARMIIVTRDLNAEEQDYFKNIKIRPQSLTLAMDALALVVNKENPDSVFTMEQVRKIMNGTYEKQFQLVFDNQNSSTVRYIIDSINGGKPLPANTMAAKTNPEVVDYVAKNKNAIGIIGVNWISDTNDVRTINFISKVTVCALRADNYTEFVKPFQVYIATRAYPLTRTMNYVLKEPYQGLGSGFASFLGSEPGQKIIGRFKLFPKRLNIVFRDANLK
ncbi:phosphate transport system substrate-binding protein [Chitinophaga skermanii]|uniref:Phosphate transport system substrate-binding protein n=1 Tax=Chitinophaga skermanii TaxID=331697 RepID=A0A327Q415_9BACT|nr:substrate-binding domain-containing protein [Chitinophaga skermanii]RAI98507.1 phosphate transport system substrate-binding protein [Chitinophaga skermanii]